MKNAFLIFGNKYEADRALESLLSKCGIEDVIKINDFESAEDVRAEMCSSDMFSSKRVIVFNQMPQKMATELTPFLNNIPKGNIVVFISYESYKASRKFCNHFKKNETLYEFNYDDVNPFKIVQSLLSESKKNASDDVVDYLINTVGVDVGILISEVAKLCNYLGTRGTVKTEDIDEICCKGENFVIWDYLNAMSSRNRKASCKALSSAKQAGYDYEFLLAMLIRNIKLALFLREGNARKMSEFDLKEQIGALKKSGTDTPVYGDPEIRRVMQNPGSFYNKFKMGELSECLLQCYRTEVEIRKLYDSEDKKKEMMVLTMGICVPSSFGVHYSSGDIL